MLGRKVKKKKYGLAYPSPVPPVAKGRGFELTYTNLELNLIDLPLAVFF